MGFQLFTFWHMQRMAKHNSTVFLTSFNPIKTELIVLGREYLGGMPHIWVLLCLFIWIFTNTTKWQWHLRTKIRRRISWTVCTKKEKKHGKINSNPENERALFITLFSSSSNKPTMEVSYKWNNKYCCVYMYMYVCTSMHSNVKVRMLQDYHILGIMWKTEWISGKSWSFTIPYT